MSSILLNIKPRFVIDILNGKKTIEIRKTKPRCELPIRVYIYCGKIIGYFTLKTIETIKPIDYAIDLTKNENKGIYWLVKESCLSFTEFVKYKGKYAWYIDDVVVYDNPRELKEFNKTHAPQSYCYIDWIIK